MINAVVPSVARNLLAAGTCSKSRSLAALGTTLKGLGTTLKGLGTTLKGLGTTLKGCKA
jgi:hypothetical protein